MTSNYNEIHIYGTNHKYKEGDVFTVSDTETSSKLWRFDGLTIQRIGYNFGTVLHFDYEEWFNNKKGIERFTEVNRVKLLKREDFVSPLLFIR